MPWALVLTSNFTHRTYNAVKRKLRPNFSMYRVVQFKPSCFTSNRRSKYSTYICKGQIISEQNCGVLSFPKMRQNIAMISALATKMGQIRKIKARAEILAIFRCIFGKFKTPHFCSEIIWPLVVVVFLSLSPGAAGQARRKTFKIG